MTEQTHRKLDIAFKVIAAIAAVVTFYVTKQKEIDYAIWNRKSDIYANVSLNATKMLTEKDGTASRAAFIDNYLGLFRMIAEPNSEVSKAASEFHTLLTAEPPSARDALQKSARKLAEECGKEIRTGRP